MKSTLVVIPLGVICSLLLLSGTLISCGEGGHRVEIETRFGTMTAVLYDDTPLHRDNFLKLAREGAYDSLLFHRVLRDYIVQGGDPKSKGAESHAMLGMNSIGTEIDAEILYPTHYHKRGALAAARTGDSINPEKRSSGSQFYIVCGSRQTDETMNEVETIHDNKSRRLIYLELMKFYQDSLQLLQDEHKAQELSDMQLRIVERVEDVLEHRGKFSTPEEVREVYRTEGGLPQLDGDYTVFGEVIDGFNVLDSINIAAVNPPAMRPASDIWMVVRVVD